MTYMFKVIHYCSPIEMGETKVKMNKLVYLGISVLDISKTLIYEFWV